MHGSAWNYEQALNPCGPGTRWCRLRLGKTALRQISPWEMNHAQGAPDAHQYTAPNS